MDLGRQGARPEGPRLEAPARGGVFGKGEPHQIGGLEAPPSGVQGGGPTAKGFSRILNTQDDLSGQHEYGPRRFTFFASWPSGRAQTKMVA